MNKYSAAAIYKDALETGIPALVGTCKGYYDLKKKKLKISKKKK